jgi:hypothetical protein
MKKSGSSSNKQSQQQHDIAIPILPCPDLRAQVTFYEQLGFEVLEIYTSPNPYAALKYGEIHLHFYGSRKIIPAQNSSMCYLKVEDVDAVYDVFTKSLKTHTGKIPRAGLPRITKVRDLSLDRRFTLTDTGGNTFFIGTPVEANTMSFFRTLQNEEFAKTFAVLYDVVYSKEDSSMAEKMLPKYQTAKTALQGLDKAKFLLVELEIQRNVGKPIDDKELKSLLDAHTDHGGNWRKVKNRYSAILKED